MPANPKYLTPRFWPRFSKISAAVLGGYAVSVTFHQMLIAWFDKQDMVITMAFTGFLAWVALMIVAFLAKSAIKIWAIYISLSAAFAGLAYIGIISSS